MGFFAAIFEGMMRAVNVATTSLDQVAEATGAPPIVKAATSSMREMTERGVAAFEGGLGEAGAAVSSGVGASQGFFAGAASAIGSVLGMGKESASQELEPVKLGGNALKQQILETRATVKQTPFDASMANLGQMAFQNVGTDMNIGGPGIRDVG